MLSYVTSETFLKHSKLRIEGLHGRNFCGHFNIRMCEASVEPVFCMDANSVQKVDLELTC